jgi:CheY-like chemotaxis protein
VNAAPSEPHRILVVEDDIDLRESICMLLEMEGFDAVGVGNGQEALDYLGAQPTPCVILLDMMMPKMNGPEFRARQLADAALAKVPTVVLSAIPPEQQQLEVKAAAAYLSKPVRPAQLSQVVRKHCACAA